MTLTVHGLLHVADAIERIGPVWAWWSFPIERQCGRLQRHITSRRHPFTNLDNYITLANQFKTAKLIYNITDEDLSLDGPVKKKPGLELHDECTCSPPHDMRDRSNVLLVQTKELLSMATSVTASTRMENIRTPSNPACSLALA